MISDRRVGSRRTLDNLHPVRVRGIPGLGAAGNSAQYGPGVIIDSAAQANVTGGRDGLKRFDHHQRSHFTSGLG